MSGMKRYRFNFGVRYASVGKDAPTKIEVFANGYAEAVTLAAERACKYGREPMFDLLEMKKLEEMT